MWLIVIMETNRPHDMVCITPYTVSHKYGSFRDRPLEPAKCFTDPPAPCLNAKLG